MYVNAKADDSIHIEPVSVSGQGQGDIRHPENERCRTKLDKVTNQRVLLLYKAIDLDIPFTSQRSPVPIEPSNTPPQQAEEPDVSAGGSIAARMAALRGAGMQVQTSHKRVSRDLGGSASSGVTPNSAGLSAVSAMSGNRSPIMGSGKGSNTPVEQSGSRRGSVAGSQPYSPQTQLDQNKTGSSFTSIKSTHLPSRLHSTPHEPLQQAFDQDLPGRSPASDEKAGYAVSPRSAARALPSVPTVSSHHHKASLPNLPLSQPTSSFATYGHLSNGNSSANPSPTITPARSRQNTISSAVPEQDDQMAHFSSQFPSLDEFEHKPDFAMPLLSSVNGGERPWLPRQKSGNGRAVDRPDTITESGEDESDGFKIPRLPSPPRNKPGPPDIAGPNGLNGLGPPDVPQRPSSLPIPDTESLNGGETSPGLPALKPSAALGPPPLAPKPQFRSNGPVFSSDKPAIKPALPFTNSIMPRTLADYLDNAALKVLLIDTRSYNEHKSGWIGQDLQLPDGRTVDSVWVDPTILQRHR
jgi:hypothetical protein